MSSLADTMRPASLGGVLGQEAAKRAIRSFDKNDNWPKVFLLYGPPGTGKTTLAKIIAEMAGADESSTHEVNASADNGVDAARTLADISASDPFSAKRRVIILNEAHQLTPAAQNALKDPMEKNNTIWLLTTDKPDKLEPAIKSRAAAATFELKLLNDAEVTKLVVSALDGKISGTKGAEANEFLIEHNIRAPREILGILDQYLAGVPLEEAVHGSEHEPLYPEVATAVLSGNWTRTSGLLKQIKTADYRAMVAVVSAKMSWALLDESIGPRGDAIATCLVGLGANQFQDGVAYSSLKALLYKCCRALTKETK